MHFYALTKARIICIIFIYCEYIFTYSAYKRGVEPTVSTAVKKVFIDGSAGTTGLRIHERLGARDDIVLHTLSDDERKDPSRRKEALNYCDIAFLCLPDAAATEAVEMIDNPDVIVIDTSTAHRTSPGWAYGFPELSTEFAENIAKSRRIAVPGCHAGGFIALVYPLISAGIIRKDAELVCHSLTGYSGGGKKMISEYETEARDFLLDAPRQYALGQNHKHLKEMKGITGLEKFPVFCPIVSDFYSGMEVTVPLFADSLAPGYTAEDIRLVYKACYGNDIVSYCGELGGGGFVSAHELAGRDSMKVGVFGNDERILLVAVYDNLGKGASGAAVECMNIVTGAERTTGLVL